VKARGFWGKFYDAWTGTTPFEREISKISPRQARKALDNIAEQVKEATFRKLTLDRAAYLKAVDRGIESPAYWYFRTDEALAILHPPKEDWWDVEHHWAGRYPGSKLAVVCARSLREAIEEALDSGYHDTQGIWLLATIAENSLDGDQ
jgi:hypothetical protein